MAGTPTAITTETKPASGTPNGAAPESPKWAHQLPPDLRQPSVIRHKEFPALVKDYLDLEKVSLRMPGADASQEERDAFYNKLGRPETPDKYELKFPEGTAIDEKLLGSFRETAHKFGLSTQQAQNLAEWWTGQSGAMLEAQGAAREAQITEWNKQLDTEWGWQRDKNTALAGRALASMVDGNTEHPLVKLMDETGLGHHPVVLKFFYEQALKQGEDKLISAPTEPSPDDRASAQEQIRAIRGDKEHPFNDRKNPAHRDAVAHMQRLYAVAYPKEG